MGKDTAIAWCHHTYNPWWGCTRVSPGCEHCYAETWDRRWGGEHWGPTAPRRMFGDAHWREPFAWDAAAARDNVRRRVFCASMADVFEDRLDLDARRERLWALIYTTPNLDWLLLTKRPECVARLVPSSWYHGNWPNNAWLGVTAEDQQRANERIPLLLACPAPVRFVSAEPMLGSLDLSPWLPLPGHIGSGLVDWVIPGGESGRRARPCNVEWIRDIVRQCKAARVPAFVKQLGANPWITTVADNGRSEIHDRLTLRHPKGGDPLEWDEDLRVREVPHGR